MSDAEDSRPQLPDKPVDIDGVIEFLKTAIEDGGYSSNYIVDTLWPALAGTEWPCLDYSIAARTNLLALMILTDSLWCEHALCVAKHLKEDMERKR